MPGTGISRCPGAAGHTTGDTGQDPLGLTVHLGTHIAPAPAPVPPHQVLPNAQPWAGSSTHRALGNRICAPLVQWLHSQSTRSLSNLNLSSQVGWGLEQRVLVEAVPAQGRGLELDKLKVFYNPNHFVIQWRKDFDLTKNWTFLE